MGWMAFYQIHPFGFERDDIRSAIIAFTVANSVPRKRGVKGPKFSDYLPRFREKKKPQTPQEMQAAIMKVAKASGHQVIRERPEGDD